MMAFGSRVTAYGWPPSRLRNGAPLRGALENIRSLERRLIAGSDEADCTRTLAREKLNEIEFELLEDAPALLPFQAHGAHDRDEIVCLRLAMFFLGDPAITGPRAATGDLR